MAVWYIYCLGIFVINGIKSQVDSSIINKKLEIKIDSLSRVTDSLKIKVNKNYENILLLKSNLNEYKKTKTNS